MLFAFGQPVLFFLTDLFTGSDIIDAVNKRK